VLEQVWVVGAIFGFLVQATLAKVNAVGRETRCEERGPFDGRGPVDNVFEHRKHVVCLTWVPERNAVTEEERESESESEWG